MTNDKLEFNGKIIIIGFGAVGQATLPILFRHINIHPERVIIVTGDERGVDVAKKYGVEFKVIPLVKENYREVLLPLLAEGDFLLNISVHVSSLDLIDLCGENNVMYLDTCIEPWEGGYIKESIPLNLRTNYHLREEALSLRKKHGVSGPTAVLTQGANPGIISCFMKEALVQVAKDTGKFTTIPTSKEEWALLAQSVGIKTIHIAEHDFQISNPAKEINEFTNTWSVDGFVEEGLQPSELGWGTHEKEFPSDAHRHTTGNKSAIYFNQNGMSTKVKSWTPLTNGHSTLLITHGESISIADYLTVGDKENPNYRPTVHYAYSPSKDTLASLEEFKLQNGVFQDKKRVVVDEIVSGIDELGILLMGHAKGAYWYGSRLSTEEAKNIAPHNSATTMQVVAGVVSGMIFAMKNPKCGIIEPEDLPHEEIMNFSKPYLGEMVGEYSNWTPLASQGDVVENNIDHTDPWQFKNFLIKE